MAVIMADRQLAKRARVTGTDAHGDTTAAGFGDPGPAYPGIASMGGDVPEYQPGGRTWTITADPDLWPVAQQDLITDVDSGETWEVQSAQLVNHTIWPFLNHIEIQARTYSTPGGTKA